MSARESGTRDRTKAAAGSGRTGEESGEAQEEKKAPLVSWPEDGSPLSEDTLVRLVRGALLFTHGVRRHNQGFSVPWHGPGQGELTEVGTLDPAEALSAEELAKPGRDALEAVIEVAIQLGMEQGRRVTMMRLEGRLALLERYLEAAMADVRMIRTERLTS